MRARTVLTDISSLFASVSQSTTHMFFPLHPRTACCAVALSGLAACAVGPDFRTPAVSPPDRLLNIESTASGSSFSTDAVEADWWKQFQDPVLTSIESRVAEQNLELQAADARIWQSRARLRVVGADAYPSFSVNASELRERASPNGILRLTGPAGAMGGTAANGADPFGTSALQGQLGSPPYSLWQYGIDATWEIDIWGKIRRAKESAQATADATVYDREAVRVLISAEVARAYLALRGVQAELAIARKNQEIAQATLRLATRREEQGVATRYDAASANAELATINAIIPDLDRQRAALMNALALLLGEAPHALDSELSAGSGIPAPPAIVPIGLSSDLARRRPDILRAEAELHAAVAAIGVAKANFYPSISLTGSFGIQALKFTEAGDWSARQFAVGPVLHLPIFEGGRLMGTLALTKARHQEAAIRYRQTVLTAWHEVDDAMTAYRAEQSRDEQLGAAVENNRIAFRTAQQRYAQGASTFLSVLIAQRDLLATERALARSRTELSISMVRLYKVLGGGWSPDVDGAVNR